MKELLLLCLLFQIISADMITRTKVEMGTFVSISLDATDKKFVEDGFEIVEKINLALSSYDKNASIYKLNNKRFTSINNYTYKALTLSKEYYYKTDGYFDITIGSITKDLYRFGEDERVPSKESLHNAKVNFNGISFTKDSVSVKEGIKVDLGGMGKGYCVDEVASYFASNNLKDGIISASGDIRCLGICSIDIQDPFSDDILASFTTKQKNSSISTSGNYNRYVDSTKYNHLINPKTKESQHRFISITLISNLSNSDIDAYATATSVMPLKKAYQFLDSLELAYIVLQSDGVLILSTNIENYTSKLFINYTKKK